jgi:hypothetical protein
MGIPFGNVVMANEAALAKSLSSAVKDGTSKKKALLSEKPIMKSEYPADRR